MTWPVHLGMSWRTSITYDRSWNVRPTCAVLTARARYRCCMPSFSWAAFHSRTYGLLYSATGPPVCDRSLLHWPPPLAPTAPRWQFRALFVILPGGELKSAYASVVVAEMLYRNRTTNRCPRSDAGIVQT